MAVVAFVVWRLALTVGLAVTALSAGGACGRRLTFATDAEAVAIRALLGFGLLGTAGALLGLAGVFAPTGILVVLAAGLLAGAPTLPGSLAAVGRLAKMTLSRPVALVAVALAAAAAIPALWPPHVFDETAYHLPFARAFLGSHRLPFLPDLRFPSFPQLAECLQAELLAFGDDIPTRILSAVFELAAALGLLAVGERFGTRRAGFLAACLWMSMPIVLAVSGWAYVDSPMAAFLIGSFLCFEIWRRGGPSPFLAASGALCGFAVGTKMLAAYSAAALFALVAVAAARRRSARPLVVFVGASLLAGGLWYARSLAETGDPFFPIGPGTNASSPYHRRTWNPKSASYRYAAQTKTKLNLLFRFHRLLSKGAAQRIVALFLPRPGAAPPTLSPWIVVAFVLAVVGARASPAAPGLLFAAAVAALPANLYEARYLIPSSILIAAAFATSGPAASLARGPRLAASALAVAILPLLHTAGVMAESLPLPTSAEMRTRFLSNNVRGYDAVEWLNRRLGPNDTFFALRDQSLIYYSTGRLIGEWQGLAPIEPVATAASGDELANVLSEDGASWLLFDPTMSPRPLPSDDSFRRRFSLRYSRRGVDIYRISGDDPAARSDATPEARPLPGETRSRGR